MPIATRLTNTGTLIVNGLFDENTSISPAKFRTTANTVYAGTFDEFTGAPVVDSSLQLWLDAGQTTSYSGSGSTWTDLSTSLNNGTLTDSPVFRTREGGGSFNFTGTACVTMAAEMPNVGSRSVTVAFRATDVTTRSGLISTRDGAGGWFIAINRTGGGSIDYCHNNVGNGQTIAPAGTVVANTWYILTVVYDLSTTLARIYLNGSLVAGPTVMDTVLATVGLSSFVAKEINSPLTLQGDIGDVILYNRVLTPAEVTQNYNALRNRYALPAATATQMPVVQRQLSSGTLLVNSGGFDEFTGAPVVDTSLQLWLDAGQTASYSGSGSTWTDLSGQSNTGTLTNSPTFSSTVGGGTFLFNGTNQTATTTSLNLQQNFTLEAWVNQSVLNGFAIFGQGITAANQGLHIWYVSNTSIRFGMFANDTDFTVATSTGTWYHMIFTYNHSSPYTKGFYLNAVAQSGTPLQTAAAYAGTGVFRLGATYSTAGNYGNGYFEGVKMYNRILTADEITSNFNALRNRYGI